MYQLIKMFDKSGFAADEEIIKFHMVYDTDTPAEDDTKAYAVETNKSVYLLKPLAS